MSNSLLKTEVEAYYQRQQNFHFKDLTSIIGEKNGLPIVNNMQTLHGFKIDGYAYTLDELKHLLTPWPLWKKLVPNIWNHFELKAKFHEFTSWCLKTGFCHSSNCFNRWTLLMRLCDQTNIASWYKCRNYVIEEMSIFFAKLYQSPPSVIQKDFSNDNLGANFISYENMRKILKSYQFPIPEAIYKKHVPPTFPQKPPPNVNSTQVPPTPIGPQPQPFLKNMKSVPSVIPINEPSKKRKLPSTNSPTITQTTLTGAKLVPASSNESTEEKIPRKHYGTLVDFLLEETKIGTIFDKAVFKPCPLEESNKPELKKVFNMWNGFAFEFSKDQVKGYEDWDTISFFLNHIKYTWCDTEAEFTHILGWFGMLFQFPWIKTNICLCIGGGEGSGKSVVFNEVGKIIGTDHFVAIIKASDITGEWTNTTRSKILIFIDESTYSGNIEHSNILKNLITSTKEKVRIMYCDPFYTDSHANYAVAGNLFDQLIAGDSKMRRYFVVGSDNKAVFKHPFFKDFFASNPNASENKASQEVLYFNTLINSLECNNRNGLKTLANFFYRLPLANYDPKAFPSTSLQFLNKLNGMDPVYQWWFNCLERKYIIPTPVHKAGKVVYFKVWSQKELLENLWKEFRSSSGDFGFK